MTKISGNGQLRHHFWGTYFATIAITFKDEASAKEALHVMPGFQGSKSPNAIIFHGSGSDFEAAKAAINKYRVPSPDHKSRNEESIDSCDRSIDFGPPFCVEIEIVPSEQGSLFG